MSDFSEYMNKPECPVEVGKSYIRSDLLDCPEPYLVKEIIDKNGKFYALCEHKDEFSGDMVEEEVYAFYLS